MTFENKSYLPQSDQNVRLITPHLPRGGQMRPTSVLTSYDGSRIGRLGAPRPRSRGGALALLPLLALAPLAASAQQTGRIVGKVTSGESGAPVGEAQVFLPGTGLGGLTRQTGA